MKKFIFILAVVLIVISIMFVYGCMKDSDSYTKGLSFSLINNGTAYAVSGGTASGSSVVIPSDYKGVPVIRIEEDAFKDRTELAEVEIPDSIISIGKDAFLNTLWLNNQSGTIYAGKVLFSAEIEDDEIIDCNLEGALGIADYAFANFEYLRDITIPDGVLAIGKAAFYNCKNLKEIVLPNSVIYMGERAFEGSGIEKITIGEGLKEIGEGTFRECKKLFDVTLPNSLEKISKYAFSTCNSLKNITIPQNVTQIEESAFYNCNRLRKVICDSSTPPLLGSKSFSSATEALSGLVFLVDDNILADYKAANSWNEYRSQIYALQVEIDDFYIEDSILVQYFGEENNIVVPDGVTEIGEYAFYQENIASVVLPQGITKIGKGAFNKCENLENIIIPNTVTHIGYGAFIFSSSLNALTLPDSIISIGSFAFSGTNMSLTLSSTNPPVLEHSALFGVSAIYVPLASLNEYKTESRWVDYANIIEGIVE